MVSMFYLKPCQVFSQYAFHRVGYIKEFFIYYSIKQCGASCYMQCSFACYLISFLHIGHMNPVSSNHACFCAPTSYLYFTYLLCQYHYFLVSFNVLFYSHSLFVFIRMDGHIPFVYVL